MDSNHNTPEQPEQPKSPVDTGTGAGHTAKTLTERLPAPIVAAIISGVFLLIASLANSYFPNMVKRDELRINQDADG